ncbi:beta-1,4-galactosyltransferase 7 [Cloeon dipterum]|uniref:beta-1,4-galactosyltransferase 7 n=1 Tax=Cloeon dipterum TaxID=197152 RepID=UPI00321FC200
MATPEEMTTTLERLARRTMRARPLLSGRCLAGCVAATLVTALLLALSPISSPSDCACPRVDALSVKAPTTPDGRLAVLVPFRDRFDELIEFVPHMHSFLRHQGLDFEIFVLNQVDQFRFNRASLINAGFKMVRRYYDYIAMHDVDLLPLNHNLSYAKPQNGRPFHVAAPELHPRYHYPTFVGGILLITTHDFELVNGMSNKYWGWGLEDDEFYVRMRDARFNVTRPTNVATNSSNTFWHNHDRGRRKRDFAKCYHQKEVTRRRDRYTGLKDVKYQVLATHHLKIDNLPFTLLNINLECDKVLTPWCECDEPKAALVDDKKKRNKKP